MASIFRRTYWANGVKRRTKRYYVKYVDADGKPQRVKGYANKEKTRALALKLEAKAADGPDPFRDHRERPLADHLADFRKSMEAKNRSAQHIQQTVNRTTAVCDGCGFKVFDDLQALPIENWLVEQRKRSDFGVKTTNYYIKAVKQFARWMVRNKRAAENRVAHLAELNADVDVRVERRAISPDGFDRLVKAASEGKPFRSICGPDRAMLYLVAASTGLRAGELHSLTDASFNLDSTPPTVTVAASQSKHKERDTVPLRADLVPVLRSWMRPGQLWPGNWHKKAATMLYRDLATARAAWIKEADPADRAAREQSCFLREKDEAGRVFDFHSLRGQFVTSLAKAGVHPRTAQKLARHKTLSLTMENYTYTDLGDMALALATLPPLRKIGTKIGTLATDIVGQGVSSYVIVTGWNLTDSTTEKALPEKDLGTACPPLSLPVNMGGLVRLSGLEPETNGLKVRCSTD
jgi:integrase